jgi:SAM-dependent methyltransferase
MFFLYATLWRQILKFTGERYIPGTGGVIEQEHQHRYLLARDICVGLDVLDVACGEGYGSYHLSSTARSVVGVDIAEEAIAQARDKYLAGNLSFLKGDCASLPLESASVDVVVSFETIEHHDQHAAMLKEIHRVLRPGGMLMISSPNKQYSKPNEFHIKELEFDELDTLLKAKFAKVAYYAQRMTSGSSIVPFRHEEAGFRSLSGNSVVSCNELARPIYFLALASDRDLPELGTSLYEITEDLPAGAVQAILEACMYFSEVVDGELQSYSEGRATRSAYHLDGQRRSISLAFPSDLSALARIRLDISSGPVAINLHGMALLQPDGDELWGWDGATPVFSNVGGMSFRNTKAGLLLLCWNTDPQADLILPQESLAGLKPGASLVIDLTPRPLIDALPAVFEQDERLIAELRADLLESALPGNHSLPANTTISSLHLARDLENLASMLKNSLARRDQTIAQQAIQLEKMREELLRAEAQLDLLKDVMLGGREEDRL